METIKKECDDPGPELDIKKEPQSPESSATESGNAAKKRKIVRNNPITLPIKEEIIDPSAKVSLDSVEVKKEPDAEKKKPDAEKASKVKRLPISAPKPNKDLPAPKSQNVLRTSEPKDNSPLPDKDPNARLFLENIGSRVSLSSLSTFISSHLGKQANVEYIDGIFDGSAVAWIIPAQMVKPAVAALHQTQLDNRTLTARKLTPRDQSKFFDKKKNVCRSSVYSSALCPVIIKNVCRKISPEVLLSTLQKKVRNVQKVEMKPVVGGMSGHHCGQGVVHCTNVISANLFYRLCNQLVISGRQLAVVRPTFFDETSSSEKSSSKESERSSTSSKSSSKSEVVRGYLSVSNISIAVSEEELEEIFTSELESVVRVTLGKSTTAPHSGSGTLKFKNRDMAQKAFSLMNGTDLNGSPIALALIDDSSEEGKSQDSKTHRNDDKTREKSNCKSRESSVDNKKEDNKSKKDEDELAKEKGQKPYILKGKVDLCLGIIIYELFEDFDKRMVASNPRLYVSNVPLGVDEKTFVGTINSEAIRNTEGSVSLVFIRKNGKFNGEAMLGFESYGALIASKIFSELKVLSIAGCKIAVRLDLSGATNQEKRPDKIVNGKSQLSVSDNNDAVKSDNSHRSKNSEASDSQDRSKRQRSTISPPRFSDNNKKNNTKDIVNSVRREKRSDGSASNGAINDSSSKSSSHLSDKSSKSIEASSKCDSNQMKLHGESDRKDKSTKSKDAKDELSKLSTGVNSSKSLDLNKLKPLSEKDKDNIFPIEDNSSKSSSNQSKPRKSRFSQPTSNNVIANMPGLASSLMGFAPHMGVSCGLLPDPPAAFMAATSCLPLQNPHNLPPPPNVGAQDNVILNPVLGARGPLAWQQVIPEPVPIDLPSLLAAAYQNNANSISRSPYHKNNGLPPQHQVMSQPKQNDIPMSVQESLPTNHNIPGSIAAAADDNIPYSRPAMSLEESRLCDVQKNPYLKQSENNPYLNNAGNSPLLSQGNDTSSQLSIQKNTSPLMQPADINQTMQQNVHVLSNGISPELQPNLLNSNVRPEVLDPRLQQNIPLVPNQMPPHALNQMPPPMPNQMPPPMPNQMPPPMPNQMPPPMPNQMPPEVMDPRLQQNIPQVANQMPPQVANQMPPHVLNQMPPHMPNQISPEVMDPRLQQNMPNQMPLEVIDPHLQQNVPNQMTPEIMDPRLTQNIPNQMRPEIMDPRLQQNMPNQMRPEIMDPRMQQNIPNSMQVNSSLASAAYSQAVMQIESNALQSHVQHAAPQPVSATGHLTYPYTNNIMYQQAAAAATATSMPSSLHNQQEASVSQPLNQTSMSSTTARTLPPSARVSASTEPRNLRDLVKESQVYAQERLDKVSRQSVAHQSRMSQPSSSDATNSTSTAAGAQDLHGLTPEFLQSLGVKLPLVSVLLVSNIDKDATEEDLKELFAMSGKVGNIRYNTEKRQAAVEMSQPLEAVQAISLLNNQLYFESVISVKFFRENDPSNSFITAKISAPRGLKTIGRGLNLDHLSASGLAERTSSSNVKHSVIPVPESLLKGILPTKQDVSSGSQLNNGTATRENRGNRAQELRQRGLNSYDHRGKESTKHSRDRRSSDGRRRRSRDRTSRRRSSRDQSPRHRGSRHRRRSSSSRSRSPRALHSVDCEIILSDSSPERESRGAVVTHGAVPTRQVLYNPNKPLGRLPTKPAHADTTYTARSLPTSAQSSVSYAGQQSTGYAGQSTGYAAQSTGYAGQSTGYAAPQVSQSTATVRRQYIGEPDPNPPPGTTLYLTNLPPNTRAEDVHELCSPYGLVKSLALDLSQHTCQVMYNNYLEASMAADILNFQQFKNVSITASLH